MTRATLVPRDEYTQAVLCWGCGHEIGIAPRGATGYTMLPQLVRLPPSPAGTARYGLRRGDVKGVPTHRRPDPMEAATKQDLRHDPLGLSDASGLPLDNINGNTRDRRFEAYCANCRRKNEVDLGA